MCGGVVGGDGLLDACTGSGSGAGAVTSVVDTRAIGQPRHFDGSDSAWHEWSLMFRAYCSLVSLQMHKLMEQAAASETPVGLSTNQDELSLQHQLYYLLCSRPVEP